MSTTLLIPGILKKMLRFVQDITPYVKATQKRLALPPIKKALAIFDVFAALTMERGIGGS